MPPEDTHDDASAMPNHASRNVHPHGRRGIIEVPYADGLRRVRYRAIWSTHTRPRVRSRAGLTLIAPSGQRRRGTGDDGSRLPVRRLAPL